MLFRHRFTRAFVKSKMHSKQKVLSLCRELGDTTLIFSVETQATRYVLNLLLTSAQASNWIRNVRHPRMMKRATSQRVDSHETCHNNLINTKIACRQMSCNCCPRASHSAAVQQVILRHEWLDFRGKAEHRAQKTVSTLMKKTTMLCLSKTNVGFFSCVFSGRRHATAQKRITELVVKHAAFKSNEIL